MFAPISFMRIASDVRKHTAVVHVVAVDDESYPLFHVALCVEKGCARDGIAPLEAAAKIILWFRLCLYNRIVHRCALYLYPAHEIRIFGFQIRICLRRLPCGQADCFFLHPLGQFIELLACAACKQDIYHKPAQRHHDQPDAQAHEQAHGPARQTLRPLFRPFCLFQSCFLDTFK